MTGLGGGWRSASGREGRGLVRRGRRRFRGGVCDAARWAARPACGAERRQSATGTRAGPRQAPWPNRADPPGC